MADVTLTITLPDIEARAIAIIAAGLGQEQFEHAYQHCLHHWKALEAYALGFSGLARVTLEISR